MDDSVLLSILNNIPCSPDDGRAYIDAHIAKFQSFILSLKSARNNLSHISRLPHELLSLVLRGVHTTITDGTLRDTIGISHVCRSWRQVALDCTSLWSRPSFSGWNRKNHRDVLLETLARAKGHPLSIKIEEPGISSYDFATLLPPALRPQILDLAHIQALHVALPHEVLEELLDDAVSWTKANMQSMSVHDTTPPILHERINPRIYGILSQSMPHLRHLALNCCGVPWDLIQSGTWNELSSLRLEGILPPTRRQFFGFLSRTHNLDVLELHAVLPALDSEAIQDVTLPKLSSCTIASSSLAECLDFQNHVSYPYNTANLNFAFPESTATTHPDYESAMVALLSSFGLLEQDWSSRTHYNLLLDSSVNIEPRRFNGMSQPFPTLRLALWDDRTEPSNGHPYYRVDDPLVSVKFPLTQSIRDGLLSILLIWGLKAVYFDSKSKENFPDSQWLNFFRRHPEITRLHLRALSAPVFRALSLDTYEGYPSNTEKSTANNFDPPLPHLDVIILDRGCEFFHQLTIYQIEYSALLGCLVGRRECGMGVRKVILPFEHEYGFQAYGLEKINRVVEELVWKQPYGG